MRFPLSSLLACFLDHVSQRGEAVHDISGMTLERGNVPRAVLAPVDPHFHCFFVVPYSVLHVRLLEKRKVIEEEEHSADTNVIVNPSHFVSQFIFLSFSRSTAEPLLPKRASELKV
jgi:hypothetical protein